MADKYTRAARRALRQGGVGAAVRPKYPGVGGASVRPKFPRRRVGSPAMRVAAGQDEEPILYSEPDYNAGEVTYLAFVGTVLNPGDPAQTIQVDTKRPFVPQDLRFPSTLEGMVLLQALIQGTNMLANSAGVPLELLSEVTTFGALDWITIDPASGAELQVQNIGTVAGQIPRGAFWGTALRR